MNKLCKQNNLKWLHEVCRLNDTKHKKTLQGKIYIEVKTTTKKIEFKILKIKDEKLGDVAQVILQTKEDAMTKETHNKKDTTIMEMHDSSKISQIEKKRNDMCIEEKINK